MNKLTQPPSAIFVNPTTKIPGADFMLAAGSPLVDKADPATAPPIDFDLAMRPVGAGPDVGAYELRSDLSSHWALSPAFKGSTAMGGIPDAGVIGAGGSGAGGSSGGPQSGGGCKCEAPGAGGDHDDAPALLIAFVAGAAWAHRRRASRTGRHGQGAAAPSCR